MVADGYKETEIGVIPVEWDVKTLVEVSKIVDSLHLTPSFVDNGISMVRVSDIKLGNLNLDDTLKVSEDTFITFTKNYTPKMGDIVLSRVGSYGVSSYVSTNEPFCMGQNTVVINPLINNRFIYYILNSNKIFKQIEIASYGSGYKSLSLKNIKDLRIPLPPLKEQEKIADILSTADDKIDAIASQIEKAETLKKGLQQKLLTEGIKHSEFKDTGLSIVYPLKRIPTKWKLKILSDITTKITDGAHFTPTYVESGIPFLRVTDLKSKDLLASEIKYIPKEEHLELLKRCKPEYGDILYSKNGTIGLTRIVNWDWEFSIFVSLCLIKPNRDLIIPEYLKYYLTSNVVNAQIKIRAKQGTVTNLHLEEIRDFFITIPPLKEQKQIADILSTADEKLEVLRAKKQMYETLKKGLLQKLLSGEVRV